MAVDPDVQILIDSLESRISEHGNSVRAFGAAGDGITDDTAAIQAAIDALPDTGGRVLFPQPDSHYLISSTIDITGSGRGGGIELVGVGGPRGFNESPPYSGVAIRSDTTPMTMVSADKGSLQHRGPTLRNLSLIGGPPGIVGLALHEQLFWTLDQCLFADLATGLYTARRTGGSDNSWGMVDNCSFLRCGTGIDHPSGYGFMMNGGSFNSTSGTNIKIGADSQHVRIVGTMFDIGIGIDCTGGNSTFFGCKFERTNPGIRIQRDPTWNRSGRGNNVISCTFGGSGTETGIDINNNPEPAEDTSIIAPVYVWLGQNIVDNGVRTNQWPTS